MARSARAASAKLLLWFVTLVLVLGGGAAPSPWAQGELPPVNFTMAFLGDQGLGSNARAVLTLIKEEGAQAVIHLGDFDYQDNPPAWDAQINDVLGPDFPYFAVTGNHDTSAWSGPSGYGAFVAARMRRVGVPWVGQVGIQFAFKYAGIFMVMTAPGTTGSGHEGFIRQQFAADDSMWRISAWHKNMRLMQVGGKSDETGWGVYEESRKAGAIVATAHEHSYHRTHLMSSFQNQTVASTDNRLTLAQDDPATAADEGRSFVFVSGLGGQSIRDQELSGPWWASTYTSTQNANSGALFGTFNYNGNPRLAHFYFKDINGKIADDFFVSSRDGAVTPPDTTAPAVSVTSPASGQMVSGVVRVTVTASDNVGVTRVDYLLDGQTLAVYSPAVYSYKWDSRTATNGSRTLGVRAYDQAGNVGIAAVTVTAANRPLGPRRGPRRHR
jgi:hypothetical protein